MESLNSVLDDNRLLTLPSGWRIQFGPNVNFFFETHNLNQASPATVSRIGIVLLSEEDLNVDEYVKYFVESQSEDFRRSVGPLIDEYFMKCKFYSFFYFPILHFWTVRWICVKVIIVFVRYSA